jgi:hypothetical protein
MGVRTREPGDESDAVTARRDRGRLRVPIRDRARAPEATAVADRVAVAERDDRIAAWPERQRGACERAADPLRLREAAAAATERRVQRPITERVRATAHLALKDEQSLSAWTDREMCALAARRLDLARRREATIRSGRRGEDPVAACARGARQRLGRLPDDEDPSVRVDAAAPLEGRRARQLVRCAEGERRGDGGRDQLGDEPSLTRRAITSATDSLPWSPSRCRRTATWPASSSLSPTTSM